MKRRIRWRWIGALIGAGLVAGLVTAWLMFQHIPSWYQPVRVGPADEQKIRDRVALTVDTLNRQMHQSRRPFEHRFLQDDINGLLAKPEVMWPEARNWLPPELSDPFVRIEPGGVRLAATAQHGSIRTVVSARLSLRLTEAGIEVRLAGISAGSLGIPMAVLEEALNDLARAAEEQGAVSASGGHVDLRDGIVLDSAYVASSGKTYFHIAPFRIVGLRLEEGACVVTFQPLTEGQNDE